MAHQRADHFIEGVVIENHGAGCAAFLRREGNEMYRTSIASTANREEIISFLERRGLVENAWLIRQVYEPSEDDTVLVCRRDNQVVGAACFWPRDPRQVQPQAYTYMAHMDAVDRGAVAALIEATPTGEPTSFWLFNPMIQRYFDGLPDAGRADDDLYFTVSRERFRPVTGEDVIEVTAADAGLFEGCERQPSWEDMADESRRFAIVRNSRVATRTGVCPITPRNATKRRVVVISGLYTETPCRRMGLGRRLISRVTEMILREGNLPMYWTEPDNIASQRLFKGLRYWQYAQRVDYLWRKP